MSNWYVRSAAAGTANGSSWTNAYTTVNTALNATNTAVGDILWVSDDHAELFTLTSLIISSPNTVRTAPTYVICANHTSGNQPPLPATDLTYTANITSQDTTLQLANGNISWSGIHFNAAVGNATGNGTISLTTPTAMRFDGCSFNQSGGVGTTSLPILLGNGIATDTSLTFSNCNFLFTQVNHGFALNGAAVTMLGCNAQSNATPMNALIFANGTIGSGGSRVRIRSSDLSKVNAVYIANTANTVTASDIRFDECNLPVSTNLLDGNTAQVFPIQVSGCGGQYDQSYTDYFGSTVSSNTIYRIGGAVDSQGFPKAVKVVPNAIPSIQFPFTAGNPMTRWNTDTTDVLTATVYGMWANNLTPTNDKIWLEVEFLSNASSDATGLSSGGISGNNEFRIQNWSLQTVLPTDAFSKWMGDAFPYSTNNVFLIQTSFQAARAGLVSASVKTTLTSASNTNVFYFDPIVYLTNSTGGVVGNTAVTYDTGTVTVAETLSLDNIAGVVSSVALI
jgi:hypothetical protein